MNENGQRRTGTIFPRAGRDAAMSTLEYAAVITVAAAAFVGMSIYLKRGLDSKWRQVGDTFGYGKQYDLASRPTPGCVPKCGTVCSGGGWINGCGSGTSCPGGTKMRDDGCGGQCCCCCPSQSMSCS